ncbi:hypothetical protein EVAR_92814_1 [Eumeta japonica]|uniref:Uncharacterized protein n=1 Tax=Eumeta variegata TaxID=151549 RepID=A0A4C1TA02_EUMVA|nr:hypothetical protein EVAR_92814_1 [Eumeta japonica]
MSRRSLSRHDVASCSRVRAVSSYSETLPVNSAENICERNVSIANFDLKVTAARLVVIGLRGVEDCFSSLSERRSDVTTEHKVLHDRHPVPVVPPLRSVAFGPVPGTTRLV